ncbi:septation protein A [Sphingomicrobium sediminis]|uniref:Inner membrane-spanning protein YciB n=1 Tax=Sphingomicrobium sediminis TaxID=2950949 RepID=A0A9X2EG79_9SPHN|nr:septation protein A [Sphingomicrobium sediminis]MCM8556912.1 septation protein A [Sphingomicrobium sediminis]
MSEVHPGPGIEDDKPKLGAGKQLLLDLGPLVIFFLVNKFSPGDELQRLLVATGAFMVSMIVAMIISYTAVKHVTRIQMLSLVMVVGFGAITIALGDPKWIKMKPTAFYLLAGGILAWGWMTSRPLLKWLLGAAYPGLNDLGWIKLSRNWAIFFAVMACLNEVVWRNSSTDFWIGFKIWGFLPLTFLFAASQMPMLMKHGLTLEEPEKDKG